MLLTPEKSTEIQNSIGADIIMQLDDVVSSTTTGDWTGLKHNPSLTCNKFLDKLYCTVSGLVSKATFSILYNGETCWVLWSFCDRNCRDTCVQNVLICEINRFLFQDIQRKFRSW